MDGKISAKFYTNNWPEFSTVVAQMTTPRLSEVINDMSSFDCMLAWWLLVL